MRDLPTFLDNLARDFPRDTITEEDRRRTELYRRRLDGMAPVDAKGADLEGFLASLSMRLVVHDRSHGDRTRAEQLINKTNQFNVNGIRRSSEEIQAILARGGRLYAAELGDRSGSHGEVFVILIDTGGDVLSMVMSCRVFQRRLEFAALCWLAERGVTVKRIRFEATERNLPARTFLESQGFGAPEAGFVPYDPPRFLDSYKKNLDLFDIEEPGQ